MSSSEKPCHLHTFTPKTCSSVMWWRKKNLKTGLNKVVFIKKKIMLNSRISFKGKMCFKLLTENQKSYLELDKVK